MKWGNYIKRTAVRRVVWIVVGLVVYAILSSLGVVHAQTNCTGNRCNYESEGEAFIGCNAEAERFVAAYPDRDFSGPGCRFSGASTFAATYIDDNGNEREVGSQGGTSGYRYHRWTNPEAVCSARPPNILRVNHSRAEWSDNVCGTGCEYLVDQEPNNCRVVTSGHPNRRGFTCWYNATATGNTCAEDMGDGKDPDAECPAGEVRTADGSCQPRGDCPVGQHELDGVCTTDGACPAGHVKAPDGSCTAERCPDGQARGADGTCKADTNEDGTPDEDEEDGDGSNKDGMEFSGGESCEVPPTCSGDSIMCGQARIQWRIDCNTRRVEGGHGGMACSPMDMPICAGANCDWVEHQQLIQQWKSACSLAALAETGLGSGDGDGTAEFNAGAVGEGAADGASGTIGDGGDPSGAFSDGSEGGAGDGELDTGGLGFGTSCPALPSVQVLGVTLDFNEIGPELCDWMSLGGYIVLILSSLLSLRILAGGMNV